ncbi:MAG: hypothetical protein ACXWRE_13895 [Pseudobdellovibrionaceae bacterium]
MSRLLIVFAMALNLLGSSTFAAPICSEIFNTDRPKNSMQLGLKNWNRIKFSDGSELGLAVIPTSVDYGIVESNSLRGTFYFTRIVEGEREIFNQTPSFIKFDYKDLGINGKFLIARGLKTNSGERLLVRVRILQLNSQTGLIKFGAVQIESEKSNGWFADKSIQVIKTYSLDEVVASLSTPLRQLTAIGVDTLTGKMDGYFELPEDLKN